MYSVQLTSIIQHPYVHIYIYIVQLTSKMQGILKLGNINCTVQHICTIMYITMNVYINCLSVKLKTKYWYTVNTRKLWNRKTTFKIKL